MTTPTAHRRAAELIPVQMRACATFGMLIAQGVEAEEDALRALLAAARKVAPEVPAQLLHDVLLDRLRADTTQWEMCRDQTQRGMWRSLEPLLQAKAPSREILAAARDANEGAARPRLHPSPHWSYSRPLLRHEVNDLVRRRVAHWIKMLRERAA